MSTLRVDTLQTTDDSVTVQVADLLTSTDAVQDSAVFGTAAGTGAVERTQEQKNAETLSVLDFGAIPDGVFDCTAAFQAAVNAALVPGNHIGEILIPKGVYLLTDTVTVNLVPDDYSFEKANVVNIVGAGSGNVLLKFIPATDRPLFNIVGAAADDSFAHHLHWRGFKIVGSEAFPASGIKVSIGAYGEFEDIYTLALFGTHYDLIDAHTWTWIRCQAQQGGTGLRARRVAASYPNALSFFGSSFIEMDLYAMWITGGSSLSYYGGAIESCGKALSATNPAKCPVFLETPGNEGGLAALFSGVYFEGNVTSLADVYVTMQANNPVTVNATGCMFQRISPTQYSDHHILVAGAGGVAQCNVNVSGTGFRSFNGYSPSAGRQVVSFTTAGAYDYVDDGAIYGNAVERPDTYSTSPFAMVTFNGTSGVVARSKNVASVDHLGAGQYAVNFIRGGRTPFIVAGMANANMSFSKLAEGVGSVNVGSYFGGVLTDTSQVTLTIWD